MTVTPRPDQIEWIDGIAAAFRRHRRVCGVASTGFGKTVCFSEITRRTALKGKRVAIVAHRIEIVDQIGRALTRSGVIFGRIGMPLDEDAPVLIGMVQTVANRAGSIRQPDLLVVDECHHATAGSYRRIAETWPDSYVLGVTATPQRTDGTGLVAAFDEIVLGPPMAELIARGNLAGYRYLAPLQQVDLSGVKTRAGDYAQDQLADAMDRASITGDAVQHYAKHLAGAPAIAFCISVEHAKHVAEAFNAAGWRSASVDGGTDKYERADRIAAIGDGRLNVLASCDLISEGTDIPSVAGALLMRPTKSLIIYMQQVGRVLRPKPDGTRATILDHCGNVFAHGLPDEPREWSLQGSKVRAPVARIVTCPACYVAHRPAPKCPECGHSYAAIKEPRRQVEKRDGELVELKGEHEKHIAAEMKLALKSAKTRDQVEAIRVSRGYKPGWTDHVMRIRGDYSSRYQRGGQAA